MTARDPLHEHEARRALLDAALRLEALGLNHNAAGNLSMRIGGAIMVTPTGIPTRVMTAEQMVLLDTDGRPLDDDAGEPTSEWRLHLAIMRARPDIDAIVHTHSPEATAVSTLARPVPAVHYVVARFGANELPCARYATYGSAELAAAVLDALGPRALACLMANHGALAAGRDLATTLALAVDIEWFCGVYRRAVQVGEPVVLDADEIARVEQLFAGYGQRRSNPRRRDL